MSENLFLMGWMIERKVNARREIGTLRVGQIYSQGLVDAAYGSCELVGNGGERRWRYNTSKHCSDEPIEFLEVGFDKLRYVGKVESSLNNSRQQA
jgi:hypothetical protein